MPIQLIAVALSCRIITATGFHIRQSSVHKKGAMVDVTFTLKVEVERAENGAGFCYLSFASRELLENLNVLMSACASCSRFVGQVTPREHLEDQWAPKSQNLRRLLPFV